MDTYGETNFNTEKDGKHNTNYFDCNCGGEVIRVQKFEEKETSYEEYYISIYRMERNYSILNKLKHIWKIIKYGHPYEDDVIFNKKEFERFKKYINNI